MKPRVEQSAANSAVATDCKTHLKQNEENVRQENLVDNAKKNLARSICLTADDLPVHGIRWGAYAERIRKNIAELQTPTEVLHFAQSKVGFEHRIDKDHEGKFTPMYENELAASYPHFAHLIDSFGDIEGSDPKYVYQHKGRLISNVLFYYTRIIMSCVTCLPQRPEVILEIGGGYGAPARLWMQNPIHNPRTYVILDMPESLFFAEVFLRARFGVDSVWYVSDKSDQITCERAAQFKFILVPLQLHAQLRQLAIDLAINTGSLQEMEEDWVDFYKQWLDGLTCRFFYTLNYFAQPLNALYESCNLWSPRLSPAWKALHLKWNPPLVRMQSERNFLEAFYVRDVVTPPMAEADGIFRQFLDRSPCGESLVEVMDFVRRQPTADVMRKALAHAMAMPFAPKEALWMAKFLHGDGHESLTSEIADCTAKLEAIRARGIEAYY